MANFDKYLVNISHVPSRPNGQELISAGGVTHSVHTYSEEYWVASAPEIRLYATGSSQGDAYTNLVSAGTDGSASNYAGPFGQEPLSNIRTY